MVLLANIFGGVIGLLLVTSLVKLILKKWLTGTKLIYVSSLIALVFGVVLAAYGNADGGPLQWEFSLATYVPAQAIVLAILLVQHTKKLQKDSKSVQAEI